MAPNTPAPRPIPVLRTDCITYERLSTRLDVIPERSVTTITAAGIAPAADTDRAAEVGGREVAGISARVSDRFGGQVSWGLGMAT